MRDKTIKSSPFSIKLPSSYDSCGILVSNLGPICDFAARLLLLLNFRKREIKEKKRHGKGRELLERSKKQLEFLDLLRRKDKVC